MKVVFEEEGKDGKGRKKDKLTKDKGNYICSGESKDQG